MGKRLLKRTYPVPSSLYGSTVESAHVTKESVSRYGSVAIQLLNTFSRERINPRGSKLVAPDNSLIDLPQRLSPPSVEGDSIEKLQLSLPLSVLDMLEEDAARAGISQKERVMHALVLRNFVVDHRGAEPPTFTRVGNIPLMVVPLRIE